MTLKISSTTRAKPSLSLDYVPAVVTTETHAFASRLPSGLYDGEFIKNEFGKHADKWVKETELIASPTDKYLHESYARIIGMGKPAAHLILERIKTQPGDWFYALRAITGANPVKAVDAGNMPAMVESWLNWGRERGLCQ